MALLSSENHPTPMTVLKYFVITIAAVLSALLAWLPTAVADNGWGEVGTALPGRPQVIGFYSAGCLTGAATLPLQGEGFQVMRPSRNRYYGHPSLIAFVRRLGQQVAARGEKLLIGDLAQPRGGPMEYGHGSHQSGLDVDIWFAQVPRWRTLSFRETEALPMLSVILPEAGRLNPERWSPRFRDTLRLAADNPEVERIFVNPIIKQALCRSEGASRAWLYKLRPWWGHDEHFHVRLRCPPDSPQCKAQKPLPPGDGCDEDLDRWAWEVQQAALRPLMKKPPVEPREPVLPATCEAVLNGYTLH
jgi:penicillin-insensitive murein endopeptidase